MPREPHKGKTPRKAKDIEVGNRLRAARKALGGSQEEWAVVCGIPPERSNRYNQYETGARHANPYILRPLCERYQLTLDYLYYGRLSGLSHELAEKIKAQLAQPSALPANTTIVDPPQRSRRTA